VSLRSKVLPWSCVFLGTGCAVATLCQLRVPKHCCVGVTRRHCTAGSAFHPGTRGVTTVEYDDKLIEHAVLALLATYSCDTGNAWTDSRPVVWGEDSNGSEMRL
jgi:hypothetical protein